MKNRSLDALEIWIWKWMEKIAWPDRKTNVEVLEMLVEKQTSVTTIIIVGRKKNRIGHVLRREVSFREVIEGRMEGKRPRGSSKKNGNVRGIIYMRSRAVDRLKNLI